MVKRFALAAIVIAAFLVLAAPALAFNGMRKDFTVSAACAVCHQSDSVPFEAPKVYNDWAKTAHATDEIAQPGEEPTALPNGSVCMGCHTSNYDPGKVTPVPVATNGAGKVSWAASPSTVEGTQADGNSAFSEADIGCSACHYGANVAGNGTLGQDGNDPTDTAHSAAFANLSNADICGACHSRFAYTAQTYTVAPIPYLTVTGGTPTPAVSPTTVVGGTPVTNPSPIGTIQPQMALGYRMLSAGAGGPSATPLAQVLNIPFSGWTPTPTATTAAGVMQYWKVNGVDTPWQYSGHEGDAAQYPEWLGSAHSRSLSDLQAAVSEEHLPASVATGCLQCHSADYQTAVRANAEYPSNPVPVPTWGQAKYADTCVTCHTPHDAGQKNGVWSSEFSTQLVGNPNNPSDLCTTCHTGQLNGGSAVAGATVHNVQKDVMDGTGAIGVPNGALVSTHQGACIDCHMAPTSEGHTASGTGPQLGGNHTMMIIYPSTAAVATSGKTTGMPFSACSTCHAQAATPANPTPDPLATNIQPLADKDQATIRNLYNQTAADLYAAGQRMGYVQPSAGTLKTVGDNWNYQKSLKTAKAATVDYVSYVDWLNQQLNTKGSAKWTPSELKWQQAYTDWTYVLAEGSWGIHNFPYVKLVATTADLYANQVEKTAQTVTLKLSKSSVKVNSKVTFSGKVSPVGGGKVKIQKKNSKGVFVNWKTATVKNGKYSLKVKMTKKGTFRYHAFLAPSVSYAGGTSKTVKLVVKK